MAEGPSLENGYPRVLSTRFTFFFKVVFPTAALAVLVVVIVRVAAVDPRGALTLAMVGVFVVALFVFYAFPIKKVVAYPDHLLVSNFVGEQRVPYQQIASVREVRWINWRPVVVTLHTPNRFGTRFLFYPAVDSIFGGFGRERSATTFLRAHVTGA